MQIEVPKNYEAMGEIFQAALEQAAMGKGNDRHATQEPFQAQKICRITRSVGLGFPLGQAEKKIEEAGRLGDKGPAEILGAINYLVAGCMVMIERNNHEK